MNSKQYLHILTLAREKSFSKAAEVLNITQPTLSQSVKRIEDEVGVPLFDRTGGVIRITDAGRVVTKTARSVIDLEHQLHLQLVDLADHKTGSITIGTSPYQAAIMLPRITRKFHSRYPDMSLIVREETTVELVDSLLNGECDLAISLLPVDSKKLEYETIAEEETLLAVPGSFETLPTVHMQNRKYPAVDVSLLDERRFVTLTNTQVMQKHFEDIVSECGISIHVATVVKSLVAQIAMVEAEVGMALVPSGIERFVKPGTVSFYSIAQDTPRRDIALIWDGAREMTEVLTNLKALVREMEW